MRQVIYAMHFRGQTSPSGEDTKILKIASSGTSCRMDTVVTPTGVETTLHSTPGDLAFLEAEVRLTEKHGFEGEGVLTFGDEGEHGISFKTVEAGHLGPSPLPSVMSGTVSWRVEGGSGRFKAATGFIASTFTLSEAGELSDYHCGLLFIPD
jgi:hypothetical protein